VFENRLLRGIFGPVRDEVTGGWRILHNEELQNFYFLPNVIRKMRWAGHIVHMGEMKNTYKMFGKPERKRPLGRLWYRWDDNSKLDLRKMGLEGVDWIYLA
jgi:hypothetical protein